MAFDRKSLGYLEKKVNLKGTLTALIKWRRFPRILSFLKWMLWWPYFFVAGFIVWLASFMNTPDSKRFKVRFLKHYFTRFFKAKGLDWYTVYPLPTLEPSSLILTTRTHPYAFPFALQLFSDSVIVPMPAWLSRLHMVPFCFFVSLSRFLPLCTYPDQELPAALPNIRALLKEGYSVVVPINQFSVSSYADNSIVLYKQVEELLNLPNPTYFLNLDEFEGLDVATASSPNLVSVKMREKNDVMAGLPYSKPEGKLRLIEFFGFRYLSTV